MTSPRFLMFALRRGIGALGLVATAAFAQPSGGPYGPVPQRYAVPKAPHVYYVAPDGKADAAGTTLAEPTSIEAAIARVVTGDAIVLRGGIYRTGNLKLNQGITIQPYLDETPVLKGTRVATEWQALPRNVWRTKWSTLFPARPLGWWQSNHEGAVTPLHRFNNDMVFIDGQPLQSAGWAGEMGTTGYYIDYDKGYVYIGTNPSGRTVEITAHDVALHRPSREVNGKPSDKKGFTLRGVTLTQYAYRAIDIEGKKPSTLVSEEPTDDPVGPSPEAEHGKEVVGTLLERNIVRRNNVERLTGYFPAAVKIFNQSHRVVVRDNVIV
ncbi:MAG: right-handed parallel beta-helix repeat-containing protein, partial [Oxalobacteraceae bacterium]